MFYKALFYQNYKHTKLLLWIILALFVIHMPFQATLSIEHWNERADMADTIDNYVYEVQRFDLIQVFSEGAVTVFLVIALIGLAAMLIGLERNTRRQDFTLSLPYSRSSSFFHKWLYGTLAITLFHLVNFWVAYAIIYQSPHQMSFEQVTLSEILLEPLLGFILLYTFALMIGTITGDMLSQLGLTGLIAFFPLGVFYLVQDLIDVHFGMVIPLPRWVEFITPFIYVFDGGQGGPYLSFRFIGIGLFFILGMMLYRMSPAEHNGEFLVFKRVQPYLLVIIAGMMSFFGGSFITSLSPWSADILRILTYWIGFTIFLLFTVLIIRKVMDMRLTTVSGH
ncbi:ABC transporter permease [Salisediminibacterium beveridgei]|uniref:Putative ABC transporter permease ytrD n=1 Tax=Salisediminibacterium beveridgei TaxID=632773 RepID=A0A1D7QTU3_9BACI|nr:ABC transporter permease [Salisediminibacterium beveridgei]AOM82436.1 putative ABC transporter permease ytrD [Salisediminibacterium beveridgei]